MQTLAHAVNAAVPRFEQFGMGQGLLAAAENLGLLFRRQFVAVLNQIVTVFFKPLREMLSVRCVQKLFRRGATIETVPEFRRRYATRDDGGGLTVG